MERKNTVAQATAIEERNRTLLVFAAAGSGKTSTLTERVIQSILDKEHPLDISRLLAVTFTNSAADELKQRISKKLTAALATDPGNRHLADQLMLLGSARISTIDSFYYDLVRSNFSAAGFSPDFRLAEEAELLSLRDQIMSDIADRMYAEDADFAQLADLLSDFRDEKKLTEELLLIREKAVRAPEGTDLLAESEKRVSECADSPFTSVYGRIYYENIQSIAKGGFSLSSYALDLLKSEEADGGKMTVKYGAVLEELASRCQALAEALNQRDCDRVAALFSPLTAKVGSGKQSTSPAFLCAFAACDTFRKDWKEKYSPRFSVFTEAQIAEGCRRTVPILKVLRKTLRMFEEEYRAAKQLRGVAEFDDITKAAYRLLVDDRGAPTPLALSLRDTFDAVYIDEYQDVNAMQDAIFRAISTDRNRFMVGDIKQSIYGFRGAEPGIFSQYRRELPDYAQASKDPDAPAATIFMSSCFRCDENIIRFSNAVSGFLFSHHPESICYQPEKDDLIFAKDKLSPDYVSQKCRVLLIPPKKRRPADGEAEADVDPAAVTVNEILSLLKNGKKSDGSPIFPHDIAVLSATEKPLKPIADLLSRCGVPVNDTTKRNLFENPEVLCMFSLLSVIDNPFRDVYLAAVLRSPFFGFSLEDLLHIRAAAPSDVSLYEALRVCGDSGDRGDLSARCLEAIQRLDRYRKKAEELPVDRLLRDLYRETAVLSFSKRAESEENGTARRRNLLRLYEYARNFEAGGFKGLFRFVRYLEDIMKNDTLLNTGSGSNTALNLMTIHKSKGLEFPVCILVGTGTSFSEKDLRKNFVYQQETGISLRVPNAGVFSVADTFCFISAKERLRKEYREEAMRVLYVALTRAKERLIVIGKSESATDNLYKSAEMQSDPHCGYLATAGNNFLNWILTALLACPHDDFCEISEITSPPEIPGMIKEKQPGPETADPDRVHEIKEGLKERLDAVYPFVHLTRLPAKLSVSKLTPAVLDVYGTDSEYAEMPSKSDDTERLLHTFDREPIFERQTRGPDAAERGTATHEFLQFCDFQNAGQNGVRAELSRLIQTRFLPPEAESAVRVDELTQFFKSRFYADVRAAGNLYRETRFNIFLPAADFTENPSFAAELSGEKLFIQGVIDLFFYDRDGRLILCDYKTDRLTAEQLKDRDAAARFLFSRHEEQLGYYREALKQICGRTPDRTLIYSLPLGEAVENPSK